MTKRDSLKKAIVQAMEICRPNDVDLLVNIILTSQKEFDLTRFESALEASENDDVIRNLWAELYPDA